MTKLAFSTNAFKKFSLPEAIKLIGQTRLNDTVGQSGYQGVEIMCDRPHAYPPDLNEQTIGEIKKTLAENKLAISNLNTFMLCAIGDFHHPSWIEPDPAERQKRVRHTIDCIHLAEKLGVPTISTEPGGPKTLDDRQASLEIFRDELEKVIPVAEQKKVKILIEPEPELLIEYSGQLEEFLTWFQTPALGINFDLGHFYCLGEDPAELIKHWGDRIDHIHLEDIAADRKHHHLIPGLGAIDFKSIFQALKEIDYQDWITVELYPYQDNPTEAAQQAMEFLTTELNGLNG